MLFRSIDAENQVHCPETTLEDNEDACQVSVSIKTGLIEQFNPVQILIAMIGTVGILIGMETWRRTRK